MESLPQPVIYVTRDLERALGLPTTTPGYHIISNYTDFAKTTVSGDNILLIQEQELLDTWQLLRHEQVKAYINQLDNPVLLVFKNTPQIERICQENNWQLLNPTAKLSNRVEEKISQLDWLGDLRKYLPAYTVGLCQDIVYQDQPFILQFNRSHTGSGTFLIRNQAELDEVKKKFPQREARTAKYISGPLFTNNNVVSKDKILLGNISYQITGLPPFTDLEFATVGNDWALPHEYLNEKQIEQYQQIAAAIGEKLRNDGWLGAYGIDVVVATDSQQLYLVEINARQPASTVLESQLQKTNTIFAAHLASLLDKEVKELTSINDGAQIILRNNGQVTVKPEVKARLEAAGFTVVTYDNTKPNSDLLKIISPHGIMASHNTFNDLGKKILSFL